MLPVPAVECWLADVLAAHQLCYGIPISACFMIAASGSNEPATISHGKILLRQILRKLPGIGSGSCTDVSRKLLNGLSQIGRSPLLVMHLWDVDLAIGQNYTRAEVGELRCGIQQPDWLEKSGYPKREKREPDVTLYF